MFCNLSVYDIFEEAVVIANIVGCVFVDVPELKLPVRRHLHADVLFILLLIEAHFCWSG